MKINVSHFKLTLTPANFFMLFCCLLQKNLSGIPSECQKRLDPDQARRSVGPDLDPICLQSYELTALGGRVKQPDKGIHSYCH